MTIGNSRDAALAAYSHWDYRLDLADRDRIRIVGRGEARTVYLIGGVVYKVGRDSANRYEHEMLTAWRTAGAAWAPQTTLWRREVQLTAGYAEEATIVAMPYLPDDGGSIDPGVLGEIRAAAPQTCRENYVSHGGRVYLIDGGDIEHEPANPRIEVTQ